MENATPAVQTIESAPVVSEASQPQASSMGLPEDDLKALSTLEKPKEVTPASDEVKEVSEPVKEEPKVEAKAETKVEEKKIIDEREYNKAREETRKLENRLKEAETKLEADKQYIEFAKKLEEIPDLKNILEERLKAAANPQPQIDPEIAKQLEAIDSWDIADEYKGMFKGSLQLADRVQKIEPVISRLAQQVEQLTSERDALRQRDAEQREQGLTETYKSLDNTFQEALKKDGLIKDGMTEEILESDETLSALSTLMTSRLSKAGFSEENPPPSEVLKDTYELCKKLLKIEPVKEVQHKIDLKKLPVHRDEEPQAGLKTSSRISKDVAEDLKYLRF